MENSKIINLLQKNILELEELILDIKNQKDYKPQEINFLYSRASGIRHLIEMIDLEDVSVVVRETILTSNNESAPTKKKETEEIQPIEDDEVSEEVVSEEEEGIPQVDEVILDKDKELVEEDLVEAQPEEVVSAEEEESLSEEKNDLENTDEVDLDETAEESDKMTLGDKFEKEKSINDLITESDKLEHKISRMPIKNIHSSIGINDRFLFTRELFNGDTDKFNGTVQEIDNLETIKQAVAYLKDNFKWKKNETSLKFVDLVKRRFADA